MEKTSATPYDELAYPSAVYAQTHPGNLAAIAILSGLKPTAVECCRVLELGCGDGYNLLPMACAFPQSEFIGVDLAAQPIARGQALIERLGQKNITLLAMDVADIGEDFGKFDYIIAHGLYSWVPQSVRERVLEICRRNLSPQGVAYISYNAYPGNHLRDLVRGMMRYHAGHFPRPTDQIAQARGLIRLLSEAGEKSDPYLQILERELDRVKKYTDAGFFHDDLSAINQPFYFHEFMTAATRNGLQFLGEAALTEKYPPTYPAHIQLVLDELDPADVIGGEQYRDFFRCRAFRQTLLCHERLALDPQFDHAHLRDLFLAGEIRPASGACDVRSESAELFYGPKKSEFETDRPLIKSAFSRLAEAWPCYVSFPTLVESVRSDLGSISEQDETNLAAALLQTAIAGALVLRSYQPQFTLEISEKPVVSELARVQLETSHRVSTLLHGVVQIDDPFSRLLLTLLDGTRDRNALLAALQTSVEGEKSEVTISLPDLESQLQRLARLALLVA